MKLLLSGLDTVECAYYLKPGSQCKIDFAALREQKETIRQSKNPESGVLKLGDTEFMLSPNGTKSGYTFLISNQLSTIQFGEFSDPSFFVKFSSLALWNRGAKAMHENFLCWADSLGLVAVRSESLSRCDFAFDFHLPEVDFDEDNFVTTTNKDSQHRKNGTVQTFTFGRDEIVLRVYNKSAEIEEASKKYWFHPLWGDHTENVWRVEWQVRKETLKRFGLRTFQDLFEGYGDLLRYLVSEQTSLRVKTDDSNRSRWPVHPLWALLTVVLTSATYNRNAYVLAHEFSHVEVNARLNGARVPAWFDEGLATYVGGEPVCTNVTGKGIPSLLTLDLVSDWTAYTNNSATFEKTYCQARAEVAAWVAKKGNPAIGQLLQAVSQGQTFTSQYGAMQTQ